MVTVAILAHNSEKTVVETIRSVLIQNYKHIEILVLENGSTDKTLEIVKDIEERTKRIIVSSKKNNIGLARNMDRAKLIAKGKFIIFLCADDVLSSPYVVRNYANVFKTNAKIGHVSRYYTQFIHGKLGAVRAHRSNNIYCLANNPSGLAFRKSAICGNAIEKCFIEGASMVKNVLAAGWEYRIIQRDLINVRLGFNGASTPEAYIESGAMAWYNLIGYQDFIFNNPIGFIQVKNWGTYEQLLREIRLNVKFRKKNLLEIQFWFFVLIALIVPKFILRPMTKIYKDIIGRRLLTGRV